MVHRLMKPLKYITIGSGFSSLPFFFILLFSFFTSSSIFGQELSGIRKEKWARLNGQIGGGVNLYNMSSKDSVQPRRVPFSYYASGNFSLIVKGVALPFSFQVFAPLTSKDNRVVRQPFNQFGLSPTYKSWKFHLGWRTMNFSNYTLNGHLFLGAGVELNPGKFRFGAMFGRFLKAVPEDSAKQAANKISQYPYAAYNRFGYSFKIGYGKTNRFFDFIYFKAKDDINSVNKNPEIQLVAPGENAVIGYATKINFLKKFLFESNAAVSAVTRDLRGDSFPLEEKYSKLTGLIMTPHLSTAVYYAGDASLGFQWKQTNTTVKFQRIMPDYRSFGTYYMQTDLQRKTLSSQYNQKKGKYMASGSIGFENDNLAKKKNIRTNRTIGSAMLAIRPKNNYGASFQYSNYGSTQRPGLKSINDTIVLNQVTNSIVIAPYYMIMRKIVNHTFIYTFTNQTLNDKNKINSQNYSMTVINNSLNYAFNHMQSMFRFDIGGFVVKTKLAQGEGKSNGGSVGVGKTIKKFWNTGVNITYSTNSFQGASDGFTMQTRWNNSYRADKHNSFSGSVSMTNNQSKTNQVSRSFTELLATITYNYTF